MHSARGVRVRFLSLSLSLALLLSACGSQLAPAPKSIEPVPAPAAAAPKLSPEIQKAVDYAKANLPGVTPELIQAAAKEGKVVLTLVKLTDPNVKLLKRFAETFPFIKVQLTELSGGATLAKFQAEASAGRGETDIFQTTSMEAFDDLAQKGYILNYKLSGEDKFAKGDYNSGYWYGIAFVTMLLAYKDGKLTPAEFEKVKTWKGTVDPVFKGRVGIVDLAAGGTSLLGQYMFRYRFGDQFWKDLVALEPVVYTTINPALDAMIAGEVDMILSASLTSSSARWVKGQPVRFTEPNPKFGSAFGQAISNIAPNKNAAKLYQEWSLSKVVQEEWVSWVNAPSSRTDVKDTRAYVKEPWFHAATETELYTWAEINAKQKELTQEFDQAFKVKR